MKRHKPRFKCDFMGLGSAIGGGAQAAAQIVAANKSLEGTKYAADQSYEGAVATNTANIQIANDLNTTNIQNTKDTNATNIQLNKQTNEANRVLAEKQNQWNIEQWNRQNEYNSPAHQVELYRKAGLNPATLAGSGWSEAQQLSSAPLANQVAPQIQSPQATALPSLVNPAEAASQIQAAGIAQSANMYANIAKSAADVVESVSRIKKNKADTKVSEADVKRLIADTNFVNKQSDWYDTINTADLNVKLEQANMLRSNISLLDSQKDKIQAESNLLKFDYGIKVKFADILEKMPEAELNQLLTNIALGQSSATLNYSQARINKLIADSGTQLPTVANPSEQFLWDAYNYLTNYGEKNIIEVLSGIVKTAAPPVVKKVVRATRRISEINKKVKSMNRDLKEFRSRHYAPAFSPTAPVP